LTGLVNLGLGVIFGLLFFYQAPPFRRLRTIVAYFFLVVSSLVALLGFGVLTDLLDITT
jgi:hypothetical protein